jgi:magnesium chelatase accessory protein
LLLFFKKEDLPLMDWARDGADWPHRSSSTFVKVGALNWHVQRMGAGPVLLLAHGTGAATHSWRDLMPELARHFSVVGVDLPGHGFTTAPPNYRMNLQDMSDMLGDLVRALGVAPAVAVGHSAGAAILARMILDGGASPAVLVALNGALLPIPGITGQMFSGMAKMIAMLPVVPWMLSWRATDRGAVKSIIEGTGSALDERGIDLYARLLRDPVHVSNVLAMMANWDLEGLQRDLPGLRSKLMLVVADRDRAVPAKVARKVAALVPGAEVHMQVGLGHLSHEEAPRETASLIAELARAVGVLEAVA